jgi:hypothetical protein
MDSCFLKTKVSDTGSISVVRCRSGRFPTESGQQLKPVLSNEPNEKIILLAADDLKRSIPNLRLPQRRL